MDLKRIDKLRKEKQILTTKYNLMKEEEKLRKEIKELKKELNPINRFLKTLKVKQ